jgi:hypothetical protein
MSRIVYSVVSYIALMALAVVWVRAGIPLTDRLINQNGPYSSVGETLQILIPLLIGALVLGVTVFLIYGSVKQEKARNTAAGQRRRPPR